MKFQPFRIIELEEENMNTVYEFIILGSDPKPYKTLIELDNFNQDNVLDNWKCTCKDFEMRGKVFPEDCKHLREAFTQLQQWTTINVVIKPAPAGSKKSISEQSSTPANNATDTKTK